MRTTHPDVEVDSDAAVSPALVHFSTVHFRDDSRIREKMMASISQSWPGPVFLVVQDGLGPEVDPECGYQVVDSGPRLGRLSRMIVGGWRMFRAVLRLKPRIAHFHDPELLPWGVLLQLVGVRVVYDVHEDYPRATAHNHRLPVWGRLLVPPAIRICEAVASRILSGVVTATGQIASRFPPAKTLAVHNWPVSRQFTSDDETPMAERPREVVYVGTLNRNRNVTGMLDSAVQTHPSVHLRLVGDFPVEQDRREAMAHAGWPLVSFEGWVGRERVVEVLREARVGLLVLKPVEHEMESLPIKLFEYMAAGLPVVSSDFPAWREVVEGAECGLLVDPMRPEAIAEAVTWLCDHPAEARRMGQNGRRAIVERYSWKREAEALLEFYHRL